MKKQNIANILKETFITMGNAGILLDDFLLFSEHNYFNTYKKHIRIEELNAIFMKLLTEEVFDLNNDMIVTDGKLFDE